jgi:cyclic pyranopterin phosphate synthase
MEEFLKLIDDHGRQIRKLRLSLTDKCNLRCHYCMPVDQTFMTENKYLKADEISEIIQDLVGMGLEEVRLTGGEPLMRKEFAQIVENLSTLGLKKIALTTNGILLDKHFETLKKHKIFHLNISLDSLNEETFKRITFGNHLKKVIQNIKLASEQGFIVKVNTVMMEGINDFELFDFINFAQQTGVEVRFLELMRIGYACQDQSAQFISAKEMIRKIETEMSLKSISVPADSTSYNFLTSTGAQIGFIASESEAFCGSCSRWRLSADGMLRACLLKDDGKSLRNLNQKERFDHYVSLLGMKPAMRPLEVAHFMNAIGG